MIRLYMWKVLFGGVISGIVLGLFLKAIQQATGIKVYTLLLNVDYIPLLNRVQFPEFIEFSFHLIISILLSIVLAILFKVRHIQENKIIPSVIVVSLVIGLLLYPTTALSDRTPSITDFTALLLWLLGHGVYGWALAIFLKGRAE